MPRETEPCRADWEVPPSQRAEPSRISTSDVAHLIFKLRAEHLVRSAPQCTCLVPVAIGTATEATQGERGGQKDRAGMSVLKFSFDLKFEVHFVQGGGERPLRA